MPQLIVGRCAAQESNALWIVTAPATMTNGDFKQPGQLPVAITCHAIRLENTADHWQLPRLRLCVCILRGVSSVVKPVSRAGQRLTL